MLLPEEPDLLPGVNGSSDVNADEADALTTVFLAKNFVHVESTPISFLVATRSSLLYSETCGRAASRLAGPHD
jgi:hypothetical protein